MVKEQSYIYKKEIDWSVLREGFSIPVSIQMVFKERIKNYLKRGERRDINVILDDNTYQVKFINQAFNEQKYPGHADILQIRYSPQNPFAVRLREIFKTSFNCLQKEKANTNGIIRVPEEKREYMVLYMTPIEDTFFFDHITSSESAQIKESISGIDEEDFEYQSNYKEVDDSARIETKEQIVKVRRLDRAIGESLKLFYGYRCQVCGDNFAKKYNCVIAEAHHIVFFVSSLNNDASNIIVLCPNHHRIIHKANPVFEREKYSFIFPNGIEEKLILNKHLLSTA
ncbi:MAG: HNH endonuclease [Candidatus Brocadia sp. WS118]|nr:MAG: HNH endonuclease [Candidatus Brocadia sp. WS118]